MILTFIGIMCLNSLLVNDTPIMILRDKLGLLEMKDNTPIRNRFIELISCAMCSGFWVGFIYFIINEPFQISLLYAAIVSIGAEFINRQLMK